MLGRDHPKVFPAVSLPQIIGPTCSTGYDALQGASVNGAIIDRLGPEMDSRPLMLSIAATYRTSVGSTDADQVVTLAVHLEHGASSGGGDMADYIPAGSTGPAATITFGTSAMTTPMGCWSTEAKLFQSNPGAYNLQHAERYLRVVIVPTINRESTTTSVGEAWGRVDALAAFHEAAELPWVANSTGFGSTSTSTST